MNIGTLRMTLPPKLFCTETDVVEPLRLLTLPQCMCIRVDVGTMNPVNDTNMMAYIGRQACVIATV